MGESPQKIGWWGAKRVEEMRRLTMSAFSLPQFTQMHSKIFLTFTMKPSQKSEIHWYTNQIF